MAASAATVGEGETATAQADLDQVLNAALEDPAQRESLHLAVGCQDEYGMRSAEVYGRGVGIWDLRKQFRLSSAEIESLLKAMVEADFLDFADVYGGSKKPDPLPKEQEKQKEKGHALRVICRVELALAGKAKRSVQIGKGEQSAELKQLAEDLLAICEAPGQAGIGAADMTDGLEKIARGELAPETFRLVLNRKPANDSAEAEGGGFLLRLSGTHATSRGYDSAAGLSDPLSLTLTLVEVTDLALRLVSLNLAQLPVNLFDLDYTDLSVEVLNHKKSVQARQFAGMTPTTHGEHQPDFEGIYEVLHQLHLRVVREGEPAPPARGRS